MPPASIRPTRRAPGSPAGTSATHDVWVAELEASWTAMRASTTIWLDDLYVAPAPRAPASARRSSTWSRPSGRPASACGSSRPTSPPARFYRRHGLVELERTDGAANEEKDPDIRMAWPGGDPLAFYRGLIDAVDHELGELLNRRAAITAAVQRHKETPERDLAREREIARALARGLPRWARSGSTGSCTRSSPRAWTPPRSTAVDLRLSAVPATIATVAVVG